METQPSPLEGLWVHTQGIQITARNHELWYFTPDFLYSSEIVPDEWTCSRHTRDDSRVIIECGPVRWTMTDTTLWIQNFLERPADEDFIEFAVEVPRLCEAFLQSQPFLAVKRMWFAHLVSVRHPHPDEWIASRFAHIETSPLLPEVSSEPRVILSNDTERVVLNIKGERQYREGGHVQTVTFDCYAHEPKELTVEEMIGANKRRGHWWALTRHAINLAVGVSEEYDA